MATHFAHSPRFTPLLSERKQGIRNPLFLKRWIFLNFEDVFCSKTRIRILKLLFKYRQLNTSDIARRLKANYATTITNLLFMQKEGILEQRLSGKTRFFRFGNTAKAKAILRLLDEWWKSTSLICRWLKGFAWYWLKRSKCLKVLTK